MRYWGAEDSEATSKSCSPQFYEIEIKLVSELSRLYLRRTHCHRSMYLRSRLDED